MFKKYCELYLEGTDSFRCFDSNEKWDICISSSLGGIGRQEF